MTAYLPPHKGKSGISDCWPGPVTFVFSGARDNAAVAHGRFDSLAVRVGSITRWWSRHVQCVAAKPLASPPAPI